MLQTTEFRDGLLMEVIICSFFGWFFIGLLEFLQIDLQFVYLSLDLQMLKHG